MSTLAIDLPATRDDPAPPAPARRGRLARLGTALSRLVVGVLLCFHPLPAVLVVGWTHRMLRRRLLRSLGIADAMPDAEAGAIPPRFFLADDPRAVWTRPDRHGRPPGFLRRLLRTPRVLLGGAAANARSGLAVLAGTYFLTLPACVCWWVGWYDGWLNSFNKGYEQAVVGPATGIAGILCFLAAMVVLPLSWAHHAATGTVAAYAQPGLMLRLARRRLGRYVVYVALFAVLTLPVSILRVMPVSFTNLDPTLETASPERVSRVANAYILGCGVYLFLAYVASRRLLGPLYRRALLGVLADRPETADRLPDRFRHALARAGHLDPPPPAPRRPLRRGAAAVARRLVGPALWSALFLLSFALVAQYFVVEFVNHQPFVGWMNQPLIHLPSLHFTPRGNG
jgi:hypothetical protein